MGGKKKAGAFDVLISQAFSPIPASYRKKQTRIDDPERRKQPSPDQVREMLMPKKPKGKPRFRKSGDRIREPDEYEGIGAELERMAKRDGGDIPSPRVLYVAEALKRWEDGEDIAKAFRVEPGDGRPRKEVAHLEIAGKIAAACAYRLDNDKIDPAKVRKAFDLKPDANTTEYQRIWNRFGGIALAKHLKRR